jgi:predicted ATPase with chaperone activity
MDRHHRKKEIVTTEKVQCVSRLNFSGFVYHRIRKLSRTIADLAGSKKSNQDIWQDIAV